MRQQWKRPKLTWLTCALLAIALLQRSGTVVADYCGRESDCTPEENPICALNKESVCFQHFQSECHLNYKACIDDTEYIIYHEEYCQLEGFLCKREYKVLLHNYMSHENITDIVFGIYKQKAAASSVV